MTPLIFSRTLTSPIVKIVAGKPEESQTFEIHRDLLCQHSKYFRAALTGKFKESENGLITLDDISIGTLKSFTGWLYFGKLQDHPDTSTDKHETQETENPRGNNTSSRGLSLKELVDIWIFGDRVIIPALQNDALDALHYRATKPPAESKTDLWPPIDDLIPQIYPRTPPGAKLRAWAVERCAATAKTRLSNIAARKDLHNTEFLIDLCQSLGGAPSKISGLEKKKSFAKIDLCHFHIHESTDCKGSPVKQGNSIEGT